MKPAKEENNEEATTTARGTAAVAPNEAGEAFLTGDSNLVTIFHHHDCCCHLFRHDNNKGDIIALKVGIGSKQLKVVDSIEIIGNDVRGICSGDCVRMIGVVSPKYKMNSLSLR